MDKHTALTRCRIRLKGVSIPFTIRRSQRAKHVRIEMGNGSGLAVIVPLRHRLDKIPDMLRAKQDWILRHLPPSGGVQRVDRELRFGDSISYLGHSLEVAPGRDGSEAAMVRLQPAQLVVDLPAQARLSTVLERWYRDQAQRLIPERVQALGAKLGVTCGRITIRGQKTRWASCSPKGNLSFNWRVIMLPEPVIEYIIAHEIAHLTEMNHSRRFWSLVASYCPAWRGHRAFLKGRDLSAPVFSSP